jgi:prephenate dehydrogenase
LCFFAAKRKSFKPMILNNKSTVGIVGFGRFGKLMARYLAEDFEVVVYNRTDKSEAIREIKATPASLSSVCRQDVVIVSVPISNMQMMLKEMSSLLNPDALVIDVCSVKVYPTRWMKETLPDTVSILATHPMFGPDSAGNTLKDAKIFMYDERIDARCFQSVKSYLELKGLEIIQGTPEEHDKQIAVSLSLTHFIGRALSTFGAKPLNIDTEGYKRLLHILGVVQNDTWQLFMDMHKYNPYAADNRKAFMQAMEQIDAKLML